MGDDGIALKVLEKIQRDIYKTNSKVEIIFGETDFIYCLNKISNGDKVIIIDAISLGYPLGKVKFIEYKKPTSNLNSQHKNNLMDMIMLYKKNVKFYVIGIQVNDICFRYGISKEINLRIEDICKEVFKKIKMLINNIYLDDSYA